MENIVTKAATVSNSTKPRVIPMVSTKGEKVNLLKAPTLPDSLPMQVKKLSS